jgi:hypothetical protein
MCGGSSAPSPDPRIGEASLDQIRFAERQYNDYIAPGGDRDWNRQITNEALGIYRGANSRADQLQNYELDQARKSDTRYWGVGVPYEDRLIKQVDEMDTPAYRDAQVSRALADTQMQVDNSRKQGIREMTRRGASPESGAYGAMMNDGGRAQALAMSTAANKTRLAAQQIGLANKMQMYGGMKGMAGLGATSASLALGAGGQVMAGASGMTGAAAYSQNANNVALQSRTSGVSAGISGYNSYFSNQIGAAKVNADGDPTNSILGAGAGAAMTYGLAAM